MAKKPNVSKIRFDSDCKVWENLIGKKKLNFSWKMMTNLSLLDHFFKMETVKISLIWNGTHLHSNSHVSSVHEGKKPFKWINTLILYMRERSPSNVKFVAISLWRKPFKCEICSNKSVKFVIKSNIQLWKFD